MRTADYDREAKAMIADRIDRAPMAHMALGVVEDLLYSADRIPQPEVRRVLEDLVISLSMVCDRGPDLGLEEHADVAQYLLVAMEER